jgi:O-antigen/teichoic acid export membrane protein
MEKFKLALACTMTLFIMLVGSICAFGYLQPTFEKNILTEVVLLVVTAVVFYPAFDFWLGVFERLLGIGDED